MEEDKTCSCSAASNLTLMRKEMERYKAMYERERDQFEEFQRYSKELESEMELELKQRDRKLVELESTKRRITNEIENLKAREEQQRRDNYQMEEQLKSRLANAEQQNLELRQKLRAVEQANDDMERRERINAQQLHDLSERYDKCLERCALLETGMFSPDSSGTGLSNNGGINGSHEMSCEDGITSTTMTESETELTIGQGQGTPSLRQTATQMAARRESNKLIENMLRKIEAVESHLQSRGSPASPSNALRQQNGYGTSSNGVHNHNGN